MRVTLVGTAAAVISIAVVAWVLGSKLELVEFFDLSRVGLSMNQTLLALGLAGLIGSGAYADEAPAAERPG